MPPFVPLCKNRRFRHIIFVFFEERKKQLTTPNFASLDVFRRLDKICLFC